ncbi:MAG: hypothetical protein OXC15_00520, partial [Rhodospirillaceae bacterium]|nr:hypothetical protein [Rhodospirillaceae bacterium]
SGSCGGSKKAPRSAPIPHSATVPGNPPTNQSEKIPRASIRLDRKTTTGLYVRKEVDSGGDPQHLYHGQFTADAKLTAYFGGGDVAENKHGTIDGMIDNFMDGDTAIDATWSVTLEAAGFGDSDDPASNQDAAGFDTNGIFTGATEGDKDMMGSWMGQFFGAVTSDDGATTDVDETVYPSGVAGEFNGHFVNGHALGAFGADMMDE